MLLSEFLGPKGHWLLGSYHAFKSNNIEFFTEIFQKYGPFVRLRIGHMKVLVVADSAVAYQILVKQSDNFVKKNPAWQALQELLGNSILRVDGERWRRKRKLYAPSFHPKSIVHYGAIMQRLSLEYIKSLNVPNENDTIIRDLHHDFTRLAGDIVCKCLFDKIPNEEQFNFSKNFEDIADDIFARRMMVIPWLNWVPTPRQRRIKHRITAIEQIVLQYIDQEIAAKHPSQTLLSLLVHSRDEQGHSLTRQELRDETMTLFLAGHETTALSLSWAVYLLTRHPDVLRKVQCEVDTALQDRPFDYGDFSRLPYLRYVLNETLRLYPPAAFIPRQTKSSFEIDGKTVPPGTNLLIPTYTLHRDPRFFENPHHFYPERWQDNLDKALPKCQYMPFGAGPRVCIGNTFALVEATAVLATLLQHFEFAQPYDYTRSPKQHITLRPSGGLPITLTRRRTIYSDYVSCSGSETG